MGDWRITNNASKVETEERKDFWFCCRSPSWYVCVPRIDFCVCPFIRRLRWVQLAKIAARGSGVQVAEFLLRGRSVVCVLRNVNRC